MKFVKGHVRWQGVLAAFSVALGVGAAPAAAADDTTLRTEAKAEVPRLSLGFFVNTGFVQGKSFALFSDSPDVAGAGLAGEVRLVQLGRVGVSARAEFSSEQTSGSWAQGSTNYEGQAFAAGGMLDVLVLRYLRPYVQVTGGLSTAKVRLNGVSDRGMAADDRVLFGAGAIGLRAISQAKPWWSGGHILAFSAFLEGGYTVAGDYEFALRGREPVLDDDIPFESVELGGLSRSRAHVRVGASVHF